MLPVILGAVHALSFAPYPMWWLQIASFTGLCLLILRSPGRAALTAFCFGLTSFTAGLSWLFISMNHFGGMPAPIAALAVVLLSMYLAAFGAVAFGFAMRLYGKTNRIVRPAVFALLVGGCSILAEVARGVFLTGFPWLSAGYAHVDGPFAGLAPWVGVYGVGGIAAAVAGLLTSALLNWLPASWRQTDNGLVEPPRQRNTRLALISAAAVTALAWVAGLVQFAKTDGEPISVRLIQGNVAQQMKFDPQHTQRALTDYVDLAVQGEAQLIVLPETAWTIGLARTPPELLDRLTKHLRKHDAVLATGVPIANPVAGKPRPVLTNSVLVMDGETTLLGRYDKRHLVPFGEFIPPGFQWFIDLMQVPLGSFGRGKSGQDQLQIDGRQIAFNICYEDLFGEELAVQVRGGAGVLINVSNIGWFGRSHALPQHLNISRMRSIELQRPMLRSTNTGVTAHISDRGTVRAQLPVYQQAALQTRVQPMTGLTPYARFGMWLPCLLAIVMVLAGTIARRAVSARVA